MTRSYAKHRPLNCDAEDLEFDFIAPESCDEADASNYIRNAADAALCLRWIGGIDH